jgi:hypothetical protein
MEWSRGREPTARPALLRAVEFTRPVRRGERGKRVRDAQWTLAHNRFRRDFHPGAIDGRWGPNAEAAADEARYELGYPLRDCAVGTFGQHLYDYLRTDGKHERLPASYLPRRLARRGRRLIHRIPLPGRVHFPNVSYPEPHTKWGLQPWIVPQVEAICEHFNLSVSAGYGGHPPHAEYSDHRWGGAVDLVGSLEDMDRCTLWADGLKSGWFRRGKVFRWVGGPAHDADGVEHGHGNHCHLSWYRLGPATTIFGTPGFP